MDNKTPSKIVSLEVKNFMSIKDALLEFGDSNIISLCGYNDSGKSAITRLLEVMFYNAYANDQVRFITDDNEYWRGRLTFSDGVVYTREKYLDGRSFWELRKDDKILFTNQLQNGSYAAMSDVPEIIAEYLGVIEDELTGEELNVRRNTDKLFLINTSGGDNYKILNTVLQSDVLANASKALNDDKNKLSAEVNEKKTVQSVLQEQFDSCDVAPQEELDEMKSEIDSLEESYKRLMAMTTIVESCQEKSNIVIYDELEAVDTSRLEALMRIMELRKQTDIPLYEALESVDVDRLQALRNIMALKKAKTVPTYSELEPVDVQQLKDIVEIGRLFNTYAGTVSTYKKICANFESARSKLHEISKQYGLKVCPNCGTVIA